MRCRTRLTLTEGVPDVADKTDAAALLLLQDASPHIASVEYNPEDDGAVSIKVGTNGIHTRDGISFIAGSISTRAALNLLHALEAWRAGSYE